MLLKFTDYEETILGYLDRYLDCKIVEHFTHEADTLEVTFYKKDFTISAAGGGALSRRLALEDIVETNPGTSDSIRYVIKEISDRDEDAVSAFCKLRLGNLENEKIDVFNPDEESLTASQFIYYILVEHTSGWSWVNSSNSPVDDTISAVVKMENCSPLDVIKAGAGVYGYEYYIDEHSHQVYFGADLSYVNNSTAPIMVSTLDSNILRLDSTEDSFERYNEIEVYGKDGLTVGNWGEVDNYGRRYYTILPYRFPPRRIIIKDDRLTDTNSLRQFAQNKYFELIKPKYTYAANIADIGRITGDDYYKPLKMRQLIRIEGRDGFSNFRIIEMTKYPDYPERNTCVLSNVLPRTEDYIKQSVETASSVTNISRIVEKINDNTLDFSVKNINVTMSSTTVAGGDGVFIRKWGKIVTITGSVAMAATGNNQVIASFGTDAAPTRSTFVACNTGGSAPQSTCYITTSGNVVVNAFSTDTLRIHGMWITT